MKNVFSYVLGAFVVLQMVGSAWVFNDWREQTKVVQAVTYELQKQNKLVATQGQAIAAYEKTSAALQQMASGWKEQYERIRWQIRTKPIERR